MKASFHHAGIVVPDLDAGITFYQNLLDLKEQFRQEWDTTSPVVEDVINLKDSAAKYVMLAGDGFNVELFEYSTPKPSGDPATRRPCDPGIRHIGFVFDDIVEACDRLIKGGGTMHHGPVQLGTTWAIYCRDPFGNIVELMQTE
jgi:catechol 2,3-dioxygenase-like lactoylglutathione lyase family enzyme|tara:strand:- start:5554 stop:5985 length:432 start_codon:yes stop_codon:yes gene_type:complete